jgi:hypothetical protein
MKEQYNPFAAASEKLNFKQYAERPRREPQPGDTGTIEPLKRNPFFGIPSDIVRALHESTIRDPKTKTGAEFISEDLLGLPAIAKTLDRLSYGDRLTEGAGQATRVLPETTTAVMAALPFAQEAAGMTRTGRNIGRVISGKHSPLSAASEEFARVRSPNERAARVSEKGWVGPVAVGDELGVEPPRSSRAVKGTNLVHTHPPHPSGKLNPLSAADRDTGPVHVLHADPRGALTGYYDSLMSGQPPKLDRPMSQQDYVRQLMADPSFSSNTAENMYSLTGQLDPSMLTGGLQALRPKGGNVNMRNFEHEFPGNAVDIMKRNSADAQASIAANTRTINRVEEEIAKYMNDPSEGSVRQIRALQGLRRDLQDKIDEDNFVIADVNDRLPGEEWFGKNLRRYFEREYASTDDPLVQMADRRVNAAREETQRARQRFDKAYEAHGNEERRWGKILEDLGYDGSRMSEEQQNAYERFISGQDKYSHNLSRARTELAEAKADEAVKLDYATPFSRSELDFHMNELPVSLDDLEDKRSVVGQDPLGIAKTKIGRQLEALNDADSYIMYGSQYTPRELEAMGMPANLPADARIFKLGSEALTGEKFKDLEDYLNDLIRSGTITPEELGRLTPTMVMERKLNEEMEKALAVDRRARNALDKTPLVKQYDDSSKWVSLRPTDADPDTAKRILAHESQHLNHCIGQECYRNTYLDRMMAGTHDYYSLRNENGVPMVTIEATAPAYKSKRRYSDLSQEEKEAIAKTSSLENPLEVYEQRNPYVYTRRDNTHHLIPSSHEHSIAEHDEALKPNIVQIKGHGNQPAIAKYQDKISDFLTDLNPGFIREEKRYHQMLPTNEALTGAEFGQAVEAGIRLPRYLSTTQRDQIRKQLGSTAPFEYRSTPDPGYTVDPGEGLDVPGLFD